MIVGQNARLDNRVIDLRVHYIPLFFSSFMLFVVLTVKITIEIVHSEQTNICSDCV